MKKLLSVLLAAAAVFTMSATVFAEAPSADDKNKKEDATFSFDTDVSLDYIHTFGNAEDTNLLYVLSDAGAISGRCLKLSENFSEEVSNQYGGIYFDAADLGIENFAGYTFNVNMKISSQAAKATPVLLLFSDGAQWLSEKVSTDKSGSWITASITVPPTTENTNFGISIPITSGFSDDVALIDNISITDNYGKVIANVGDIDTSLAEAPNTFVSVITVILFVLLVVAVILGVVYAVMKLRGKYR